MADSINYQLAKFVASYGKVSQIPESTCPEVSFVGRSNVGKSSIMNKLFGRKNLVKVSSTPGKTSNINFFEADDVPAGLRFRPPFQGRARPLGRAHRRLLRLRAQL